VTFGQVIMRGETAAGVLFGEARGSRIEVEAHLISPDSRHPGALGGWAHPLLLGATIDWCLARGIRRACFCFHEGNRTIRRLAERCSAEVIRVTDGYRFDLAPGPTPGVPAELEAPA
jgi:hypothetical protein